MKDWIKWLYIAISRFPIKEIKGCMHAAGGVSWEWEESSKFPNHPDLWYRYHTVQEVINNEHTLAQAKSMREKIKKIK
ncbi:MAG: hypothetical protein ACXAC5_05165 [Promethearchaeota archaeon]|jgi:hypothetical protein